MSGGGVAVKLFIYWLYKILFLGRSPSGRAIRCNALFVTSQSIFAAIPNANKAENHENHLILFTILIIKIKTAYASNV
jgi:hypothetical protein